jgi:hypothetical protein
MRSCCTRLSSSVLRLRLLQAWKGTCTRWCQRRDTPVHLPRCVQVAPWRREEPQAPRAREHLQPRLCARAADAQQQRECRGLHHACARGVRAPGGGVLASEPAAA